MGDPGRLEWSFEIHDRSRKLLPAADLGGYQAMALIWSFLLLSFTAVLRRYAI